MTLNSIIVQLSIKSKNKPRQEKVETGALHTNDLCVLLERPTTKPATCILSKEHMLQKIVPISYLYEYPKCIGPCEVRATSRGT